MTRSDSPYHQCTPEQRAARLEATRRWRARNPAKARASKKAWLAKNPGKNAEHCRNFRRAHPETAAQAIRRWKRANPARAAAIALAGTRRYQARKRRALCRCCKAADFTAWYERARRLGMEVDHVRPLSKGGRHCTRNLQLLSRHDNRTKHAKWRTA